jgi:peptide subunit release factor 1 (eRF1)
MFPVLSVYLNTQPDQYGRAPNLAPYLHREFTALARTFVPGSPELQSFERDAERILVYVTSEIDPATQGVALFSCHGAEKFFEAVQSTNLFAGNHVSADNQPHLYLLAEVDDLYPRYAAVLADSNSARIFVVGLGHLIGAEHLDGKKVHRVKVGGWSQARYQRRAANAHHEHAKEVIERLAQVVHEDKISHIILAGDQVVIPMLQKELPPYMLPMVEVMALDIHASDEDVMAAALARLQVQEAGTAEETESRLLEQYRGRGLAVVGPQETFDAMVNGRVEELLISGGMDEIHDARKVPMPDLLVTRARQTGATVTFIEDPALLASVGGAGGFLRWRE